MRARIAILAGVLVVGCLPAFAQPPAPTPAASGAPTIVEAVTFAGRSNREYVPMREMARALGWPEPVAQGGTVTLKNQSYRKSELRILGDGTTLISLPEVEKCGAQVAPGTADDETTVTAADHAVQVHVGEKRVAINRRSQRLRAWQGERLVLETRVSTGKREKPTPRGTFRAGPLKQRLHLSHLYNDAPMPWSVQVNGNIFIHGFRTVPPRAASHGCIRLPLTGLNPARWFYRWVDVGTPIRIADGWGA